MSTQSYKDLKINLEKFENDLNEINPSGDIFKSKTALKDLEGLIQTIKEQIKEIKKEEAKIKDSNYESPLLNDLTEYQNKFQDLKEKYYKMIDNVSTNFEQKKLLDEYEKEARQRNIALDNLKELDEQGKMLDGIYRNIKESLQNILNMKAELQRQDEELKVIDQKVDGIKVTVKKTDEVFTGMEKKSFCTKFLLWLGVVILFIFDITMLFFTIAKGAGWPPFSA